MRELFRPDGPREDGTLFYYDGLCYFPFPDKETVDYWQRVYEESKDKYIKEIIEGRIQCTKKYFSKRINDEIIDTLNKMMARWWK